MINTVDNGTIRMLKADEVDKALPLALAFQSSSGLCTGDNDAQSNWGEIWKVTIETCTGGIIAYEVDDQVVGVMCFLVGVSPLDGKPQLTESMWYMKKDHRGRGTHLLAAAEELATSLGCERIVMTHLADAKGGRIAKVFKRRGFRPMETSYLKEL